ncbi:hypothetical protein AAE478_006375 [Parahypoxylon ruwenzoriense]
MTTQLARGRTTKILVLNPNSSQAMTEGMEKVIKKVDLPYSLEVHTYTAPHDTPASINDGQDIETSMAAVLAHLEDEHSDRLAGYDGILVACYSVHPLVAALQSASAGPGPCLLKNPAVTGIFEASMLAALSLLKPGQKWGIITTGKFWEEHLTTGVRSFLGVSTGTDISSKFAGVESTGLDASDFHHGADPALITERLKQATKRLLAKGRVTCIAMGCAGMAGLETIIREATSEELGEDFAYSELHVIDSIRVGVIQVEHMIKQQRLLRGR